MYPGIYFVTLFCKRLYINILSCSLQQTKVQHQQQRLYTRVVNQLLANRLVVVNSAQSVKACFRDQIIFLTYDQLIIQPLDPCVPTTAITNQKACAWFPLSALTSFSKITHVQAKPSRKRSDFYQSTTSLFRRHGNTRVWFYGSRRV